MYLSEWIQKSINEDGAAAGDGGASAAGTTTANIAYLPSGFVSVKKAVKDLSALKNTWNIQVHESDSGYQVMFEDKLTISIGKQDWDHFLKNMNIQAHDGVYNIDEGFMEYDEFLSQCVNEEVSKIVDQIGLFMKKTILEKGLNKIEKDVECWKKHFPIKEYKNDERALFHLNTLLEDFDSFKSQLIEEFGDDLGGIQMFQYQLEEGLGISMRYPVLLSERIESENFIYEITMSGKDFRIFENILPTNSNILLEASGNSRFAYMDRMIVPSHGLFGEEGINEFKSLSDNYFGGNK